uniref:Uncharacterized protein n=1 Tax=Neospora caninum (strain Liverpool) TaxID=572307 RepID=A0A0F7U6Z5_NEOCL|nr:TPA: hypothetical protein BN1204_000810 [Neospora caninum Liverpool]
MNFHFRSSRLFCKASRSVHVRPNPPPEPPSGAPENSADSPRVQIRTDASLVADSTLTAAKATAARAVEEARQAGEAATAARRDAAQAAQAACLWKDRSVCPAGPVLEAQTQMPLCQLEESAELLLRLVSALTCRRGQEGKEEALALLADAVALFNHAEETRRRAEEATSRAAAARTRAAFFTREVEARERQKEEADRNSKGAEDHARRTPGGLSLPRGPGEPTGFGGRRNRRETPRDAAPAKCPPSSPTPFSPWHPHPGRAASAGSFPVQGNSRPPAVWNTPIFRASSACSTSAGGFSGSSPVSPRLLSPRMSPFVAAEDRHPSSVRSPGSSALVPRAGDTALLSLSPHAAGSRRTRGTSGALLGRPAAEHLRAATLHLSPAVRGSLSLSPGSVFQQFRRDGDTQARGTLSIPRALSHSPSGGGMSRADMGREGEAEEAQGGRERQAPVCLAGVGRQTRRRGAREIERRRGWRPVGFGACATQSEDAQRTGRDERKQSCRLEEGRDKRGGTEVGDKKRPSSERRSASSRETTCGQLGLPQYPCGAESATVSQTPRSASTISASQKVCRSQSQRRAGRSREPSLQEFTGSEQLQKRESERLPLDRRTNRLKASLSLSSGPRSASRSNSPASASASSDLGRTPAVLALSPSASRRVRFASSTGSQTRASSRLPSSYQERKSLFDGAPGERARRSGSPVASDVPDTRSPSRCSSSAPPLLTPGKEAIWPRPISLGDGNAKTTGVAGEDSSPVSATAELFPSLLAFSPQRGFSRMLRAMSAPGGRGRSAGGEGSQRRLFSLWPGRLSVAERSPTERKIALRTESFHSTLRDAAETCSWSGGDKEEEREGGDSGGIDVFSPVFADMGEDVRFRQHAGKTSGKGKANLARRVQRVAAFFHLLRCLLPALVGEDGDEVGRRRTAAARENPRGSMHREPCGGEFGACETDCVNARLPHRSAFPSRSAPSAALAGTAQICVDFTAAASAEDERKRTDTEVTKREEGANLPQMFRFRTPNPRAAVKLLTSRPFVATFGDLLHKALQPILREGREAIRCTLPRDTGTRTGREEANGQHDAGPSSPNASLSHQRDKEGEERDSEEREGEPCHRSHNREETKKPAAERSKERRRSADRVRFADDEQEASVPAEKTEQSVSAEACAQNRVETLRIPTGRYLLTARDGAQRNAEGQSEPGDEGREHERPVESVNQERETDSQHADPQKTADDVAQHAATVPEQRKRLAAILQSRLWDVTRDVLSVYSVDPETRCSLPVAVAALLRLLADGFVLELEISNPVTALVRWPRVFRPCWLRLLLRFAPLRSLALWREAEAASDGRDERVQSIGNLGFKGEARIRGFECVLRRAGEPPPILCTIRQRLAKHLQLRRASIQTREEGWGSTSVNEEEGEAQQPSAKGEASHEPEGTEEEGTGEEGSNPGPRSSSRLSASFSSSCDSFAFSESKHLTLNCPAPPACSLSPASSAMESSFGGGDSQHVGLEVRAGAPAASVNSRKETAVPKPLRRISFADDPPQTQSDPLVRSLPFSASHLAPSTSASAQSPSCSTVPSASSFPSLPPRGVSPPPPEAAPSFLPDAGNAAASSVPRISLVSPPISSSVSVSPHVPWSGGRTATQGSEKEKASTHARPRASPPSAPGFLLTSLRDSAPLDAPYAADDASARTARSYNSESTLASMEGLQCVGVRREEREADTRGEAAAFPSGSRKRGGGSAGEVRSSDELQSRRRNAPKARAASCELYRVFSEEANIRAVWRAERWCFRPRPAEASEQRGGEGRGNRDRRGSCRKPPKFPENKEAFHIVKADGRDARKEIEERRGNGREKPRGKCSIEWGGASDEERVAEETREGARDRGRERAAEKNTNERNTRNPSGEERRTEGIPTEDGSPCADRAETKISERCQIREKEQDGMAGDAQTEKHSSADRGNPSYAFASRQPNAASVCTSSPFHSWYLGASSSSAASSAIGASIPGQPPSPCNRSGDASAFSQHPRSFSAVSSSAQPRRDPVSLRESLVSIGSSPVPACPVSLSSLPAATLPRVSSSAVHVSLELKRQMERAEKLAKPRNQQRVSAGSGGSPFASRASWKEAESSRSLCSNRCALREILK